MKSSFVLYFFPHHYIHSAKHCDFFLVLLNFDENTFFPLFNANKAPFFVTIRTTDEKIKKHTQFASYQSIEKFETSRKRNTTIFYHYRNERRALFFYRRHAVLPFIRPCYQRGTLFFAKVKIL